MPLQIDARPDYRRHADAYAQMRILWRDDICRYAHERLGLRSTGHQRQLFAAIQPEGAKVTVRSGHQTGKTMGLAIIAWWFLETRHYPRIPCTAPTAHQLRDILWGEMGKCLRLADAQSQSRGDHPRFWLSRLFRLVLDRVYDLSASEEWYAVARTASRHQPDALQGFHASDLTLSGDGQQVSRQGEGRLLFILDEAAGIADEVFQVAEGALASPGARVVMAGNPLSVRGAFAQSHREHRGEYTALHFRSQDSPLCDPDYRARLVRKFGEGSNVVRIRADGEFPRGDLDTLIPLEWAEAALTRETEGTGPRRLGVDVAWQGDDRSVLLERQGNLVSYLEIYTKLEPMPLVGHIARVVRSRKIAEIYIDTIGLGAGVYSRLKEIVAEGVIQCTVHAVNVATSSPPSTDSDLQGKILRDYLWIAMRHWMRDSPVSFSPDPALGAQQQQMMREALQDLIGELASPRMLPPDSHGHIRIEGKDSLKSRGLQSPDLADALACTFFAVPVAVSVSGIPSQQSASSPYQSQRGRSGYASARRR